MFFMLTGRNERGRAIFSKRISRGKPLDFFAAQPTCTVALEAAAPEKRGCRPTMNRVSLRLSVAKVGMVHVSQGADITSGPTTPQIARSASAERMRAHRSRRQAGLRCLTIELRETEVTELIRRKLLDPVARNDVRAIRNALHRHLDESLSA
jgi:hypothetical protein